MLITFHIEKAHHTKNLFWDVIPNEIIVIDMELQIILTCCACSLQKEFYSLQQLCDILKLKHDEQKSDLSET